MNTKKFSDAMSELDSKYVDEAINYKKKDKKSHWVKWGAMAACLCLVVVAAVTIPSVFKPDVGEGGGTPITSDPDHSISEITPALFAQQEIIEEMKNDLEIQDIQSWMQMPNTTLNFAYVIPVYTTANMTESSSTILETLMFDNQYMIPALSNGECVGAFTVMQHEGKWVIGIYESGLNIEAEVKKNENSATCFISVSQLNSEYGFLTVTDTEEQYTPISGFGTLDTMSGEQLLRTLKEDAQTNHNGDTDG